MMTAIGTTLGTRTAGWYGELAPGEKRTFWACFAGWAFDAFDVQIFSFAIPAIVATFSITNADAGLIGTVTLLTSAFGGWFAGMLADRFGRARTLQVTVLWFAIFTFLCGFAQTYHQLLVCRALMGLGFGGEWAAGAVLMGEIICGRHRGAAVGTVQSGWPVGWAAAAILSTVLFSMLPQEIAWRVLFWVGLLPAVLVIFIRRFIEDPPVFRAAREQRSTTALARKPLEIFSPQMIRTTILACLLTTGAQGGYYALFTWLPTYLKVERKLSVIGSGGYIGVVIVGSFLGLLFGAYLADRIGRRANFILYAVCSLTTVFVYTQLPINDVLMLILGLPLGFFANGIFAGMGAFLTENYPTRMRGSGQGFSLQSRSRDRFVEPDFRWPAERDRAPRPVDRYLCCRCLRPRCFRGACASRNEGS
jgi:MFS family permease